MEAPSRRSHAGLAAWLRREPHRFEFFQAVRLLELEASLNGERSAIGYDASPEREALRIRASVSLGFPCAPLSSASTDEGGATELRQSALGLVGSLGVMPQHYTELVLKRTQQKDFALRDFLDLFHLRSAAFFYRAWRKYRFAFEFEHARRSAGGDDDFTRTLRALVGLGTAGLGRDEAPEWLYFSGLFADPRRSQAGLTSMLSDVLGVPVSVEQFVGRWLALEPEQYSRLSSSPPPGDDSSRLGQGFVLGTRVWDAQTAIRARVGPLQRADFVSLLPGSPRLARVEELVRDYLNADISCELELLLAPGEALPARLGGLARLGRDTFLDADNSFTTPVEVRIVLRTQRPSLATAWRAEPT